MKKQTKILIGTIRIGKDCKVYEKTASRWKKSRQKFPFAEKVIYLFKKNGNFSELLDKKDPKFLKGQFYKGKIQGARINILPDKKPLDGAYSLFSEHLTIHDQHNDSHWDVIYKNHNGKFAYHYTLDKKKQKKDKKYKTVKEFEKKYPLLVKKVSEDLNQDYYMALPIYTLLKTHMRIGNEIYYKAHGHKGLTTLKKQDLKIKNNKVEFKYFGKDGVPQNIIKEFPEIYIKKLKKLLESTKHQDFVFKNLQGNLLHEQDFKNAFKKYVGEGFYPHIVRSYFATKETEEFLKKYKNPDKKQVKEFLFRVAEELGHKKFSKKTNQWEDSYTVTIGHYIEPKLAEKLRKKMK